MKPFPEILATIEATRQDVADCEAIAAQLAYTPGLRPDLESVKHPTLTTIIAARQMLSAAMLLLGSAWCPSSEVYGRVEFELAGALGRVSSLAVGWELLEGEK